MNITTTLQKRIAIPVLSLAAITLLAGCYVEEGPRYHRRHVVVQGPGVYASLPGDYRGDYYSHQGRYYYGGQREVGRYQWNGRYYNDRYSHNGQYYYGGQYSPGRY